MDETEYPYQAGFERNLFAIHNDKVIEELILAMEANKS